MGQQWYVLHSDTNSNVYIFFYACNVFLGGLYAYNVCICTLYLAFIIHWFGNFGQHAKPPGQPKFTILFESDLYVFFLP